MRRGVSAVSRARRPLNHFSEDSDRVSSAQSAARSSAKTLSSTSMTLPSRYSHINAKFSPRLSIPLPHRHSSAATCSSIDLVRVVGQIGPPI